MKNSFVRSLVTFSSIVLLHGTAFSRSDLAAEKHQLSCEHPPTCPNGVKEINLCIIDPAREPDKWNLYSRLKIYNNCGRGEVRYLITNKRLDVLNALKDAVKNCEQIKNLHLTGHGAPGKHMAGDFETHQMEELRPWNCAMAANASIDLLGCGTGRGCMGQMFMYKVGDALLPKGGEVIAPTADASVIIPYIKTISLNGTRRVLSLRPGSPEPERWSMDTPFAVNRQNASDSCVEEINEALALLEVHDRFSAIKGECKIPPISNVRKTAALLQERSKELRRLDEAEKSFRSIAIRTSGDWYQGKYGGFSGISDAALQLVKGMQPYLSCRRRIMNGQPRVRSSEDKTVQ